eukprot:TRINITY_DN16805_c0_g2_i1.p1 TRINITY_DN16805_c0_g2~~TRINITY_DN16805_c0_g2_i1.p1  ORF type:complete len:107 (+),score=15.97 TRINITY_DN16805_c0_g2_i1:482-802(+)
MFPLPLLLFAAASVVLFLYEPCTLQAAFILTSMHLESLESSQTSTVSARATADDSRPWLALSLSAHLMHFESSASTNNPRPITASLLGTSDFVVLPPVASPRSCRL